MNKVSGAFSGSSPSGQANLRCPDAPRFDPGRREVASFEQRRNDMHWSLWASEDKFIRWSGYDDHYWWSSVATTEQFRVRRGTVTGRIYRLDPETNEVEITEDAA